MTHFLWLISCALLIGIVTADEYSFISLSDLSSLAEASSNAESSPSSVPKTTSEENQPSVQTWNEFDTTDFPAPIEASSTPESSELTCGDNERVDDCPVDCASDRCPRSEAEAKSAGACTAPDPCPPAKCKCQFNYRRAENGTCIPTRSCPPFKCSGVNEEFAACPPLCPTDDCSQASPTGECPPLLGNILVVLSCSPQCRCKKGYWRKNGVCVPYAQCKADTPPPTPTCGNNEILDECPVDCPSDYCPKSEEDSKISQVCTRPDPCPPPACKCRTNYRRAENGTCIPTRNCPPFECSGVNEEFNSCPPYCPSDDCSQASPDGKCPKIFGRIGVLLICSPKCRCRKGFWRKNGLCRPYADCKKECNAPNEEYVLEKRTCPPEQCISLVARFDCNTTPAPRSGCACKSGFLRVNATSPCVPICECPQMRNSPDCVKKPEENLCPFPNEEYVQEKRSCPPEQCFSLVARIDCRNAPPPQPGCACLPGYLRRNATSPCRPICECPEMGNSANCLPEPEIKCPSNEVYMAEKPSCPPEICSSVVSRIDCSKAPPPQPGCACKPGYLRRNKRSPCIPQCQCPQLMNTPECKAQSGCQ